MLHAPGFMLMLMCAYALFGSICTCAIDIVTLKTKSSVFLLDILIVVTHQLRGTVGAYGASLPLRPLPLV